MRSDACLQAAAGGWISRAAVLISTMAMGMLLGATVVRGYDPRLDEALAALQKAAALVEAASAGGVSAHTQRQFDRHVNKALSSIQDATAHILAAGAAADADGSAP